MHRTDADVGLAAILLNDVNYETPVHDPLFSAHKLWTWQPGGGYADVTKYKSDNAAGVIGCAQQYRFCVPQVGKEDFCTLLDGSPPDSFTTDFPPLKPVQLRLLQLLLSTSRLVYIEYGAHMKNVLAQSFLTGSTSPGLPDNQWVKEVVAWESRVWARYQALIATAIIGPSVFDEFANEYTEPVVDEGHRELCQSLKMRKSGASANINVVVHTFVVVFTSVVTICNTLILRFFIFMSRFRAALAPRVDHWIQGSIYQLQRRTFEAQGQGCWMSLEQEIPITIDGGILRELPVESSLALRFVEGRRLPRRSKVGKNGTSIAKERLDEIEEDDFEVERVMRRPTAGTDTATLVGVDVEKGGSRNNERCEGVRR